MKRSLTLEAGKSVFGGDCLSIVDGKPCFVEGAIPGEKVDVEVIQEKSSLLRARVTRVITPSEFRVTPPCPHVERCGGCQYQHLQYVEELRLKEGQTRELLKTVVSDASLFWPIMASPKEYAYRRSATFHVAKDPKRKTSHLSYIGKDNVTPVFLRQCNLLDARLDEILRSQPTLKIKKEKITFKCSAKAIHSDEKENFFRIDLSGQSLLTHSQGFFQNNWEVTEKIASAIRTSIPQDLSGTFWDLYAGVGTFSFLSAPVSVQWTLIEESPYSFKALEMNLEEKMRKSHSRAVSARVERVFPSLWKERGTPEDVLLMDPPRQGLDKSLAEFFAKDVTAKRLIYMSCDPSTLSRDLKIILGAGRWTVVSIQPFDMFPRTKHIEVLTVLDRA